MPGLVRSIGAFFRVAIQVMFHYRAEMFLWAVWGVVYPAVAMAMWRAAIGGSADGGQIGGYDARGFAGYFIATMVVGHFSTAWDVYEMGYLIRSGKMSAKLLRPILPLWESFADNLAYKTLTISILAPIWLLVVWLTDPRFDLSAANLPAGIAATILGGLLNYLWGYNLALGAFWITRIEAAGQLWFGASLALGGRLAPISIMPLPLQYLAMMLPFQWMIYFPVSVLLGRASPTQMVQGLLIQCLWLIGGIVAFQMIWRRALRRYSAVGA